VRKIDIIRYTEVNKHFGVEGPEVTLVPTFVIEFETKFQLEVRENKTITPPSKFTDTLKSIHGPPLGSVDPRLKTADLNYDNGVLWQCLHASLRIHRGKGTEVCRSSFTSP
jgi:hypothetical protein